VSKEERRIVDLFMGRYLIKKKAGGDKGNGLKSESSRDRGLDKRSY